ncbi:MAG TPA: hypothetical protein HPQ03_04900 [Deltaproteobacteria bacterium]|nr:hypothetical protein [Deltaproteobacteria bacterium]
MTAKDKGNYPGKHQPEEQPDENIKSEIENETEPGEIPCATAFTIAEKISVSAAEVGKTADLMNYELVKCQLGLFGYKPGRKIVKPEASPDPDIKNAVTDSLEDGKLSCRAAWDIADRFSVSKLTVSGVCETMGLKIKSCQLGAF